MLTPEQEELLIDRIEGGESITAIARSIGKDRANLMKWVNADILRSARVKNARIAAAAAWDELAEQGITMASDTFELSKAKEMAHHYRWRASKIAPKDYGDKIELGGDLGIKVEKIVRQVVDPKP